MDTVSNIFCKVVVHEAVSTEADSATSINTPRRQISSSILLQFFKWFALFVTGTWQSSENYGMVP